MARIEINIPGFRSIEGESPVVMLGPNGSVIPLKSEGVRSRIFPTGRVLRHEEVLIHR